MFMDHWTNEAMVSMDRSPLLGGQLSFFGSDGMVIFFLLEPLASMVFRWFLWFTQPSPLVEVTMNMAK